MKAFYIAAIAASFNPLSVFAAPPRNGQGQQQGPPCNQCRPLPGENKCDSSTSCVSLDGAHTHPGPVPNYCACRAGYRADNAPGRNLNDPTVQFRLPWAGQEGRVFVAPGIPCNTLCSDWFLGADGCKEVRERRECM